MGLAYQLGTSHQLDWLSFQVPLDQIAVQISDTFGILTSQISK
jgi:hypothetical protein